MFRRFLFITAVFVSGFLLAQNSSASPYSLGGLGDVSFRGNAINRMMGGISVYADSIHANINNPASLGELKLTTFSVGVHYKNTQLSSLDTNESAASGSLDYIAVSIPTKRFGFSFGIMPHTSVGYRLQSLLNEDNDLINNVLNRYEGRGGVNKTFLSAGLRLFKGLNVGFRANYNFGRIETEASRQEENIDFGSYVLNNSQIGGFDFQFSAHLKLPIKDKYGIDVFSSFSPEHNLTSKNQQTFYTQSISTQSFGTSQEVDLSVNDLDNVDLVIGDQTALGISFNKEKKWMLGVQYTDINSGEFSNEFIQLDNISYEDSNRLSLGGFYIPDYSSITSYWKRIVYRIGFAKEKTGILVNNTSLEEIGMSFGVSLPLGGFYSSANVAGFSSLNVGIEIGDRGVNTDGLIQEKYWAFRVGLSLNDLWFIKKVYN